jgi:hypothetical protein
MYGIGTADTCDMVQVQTYRWLFELMEVRGALKQPIKSLHKRGNNNTVSSHFRWLRLDGMRCCCWTTHRADCHLE